MENDALIQRLNEDSRWPEGMSLRSRRRISKRLSSAENLTARNCKQLNSTEDTEEDAHDCISSFGEKNRNTYVDGVRHAAAVLIGVGAFIAAAALLVVAYTAASCVAAGKDFTESAAGLYVFEQSRYLQEARGSPLKLIIQLRRVIIQSVLLCYGYAGYLMRPVLLVLHSIYILVFDVFQSWPNVLSYSLFLPLAFAAVFGAVTAVRSFLCWKQSA